MSNPYHPPVWVPTWKAWTRALRLAVAAYALATVAPAFEVWRFCLLGLILFLVDTEAGGIALAISLLWLLFGLLWFLLVVSAYSLLLRLLWSTPPNWLRLPKTPLLVNRDFGILVTSTLPVAIAFFTQVGLRVSLHDHLPTFSALKLSYETFLLEYFWLWFIAAVFLYHSYDQTRLRARRRKHRQKAALP